MIQQTDRRARRSDSSPPPETDSADGPEIWGNWAGHRHYSLEVVQHPLRARMCGFGDKDRRPLAPAAVAKMVVRNQDKSVVDVDEIDWSFFLVLVDLWSADGKQEMNLVLHPSSADRYMPIPASKNRRRGTSINQTPASHSGQQTPIQPSPAPSYRPPELAPPTPLPTYTAHHQSYFSSTPVTTTSAPDTSPYGAPHPPPPQGPAQSWGYSATGVDRGTTYPPPILPSIHTFAAVTASTSPTTLQQHSTSGWGDATAAASASAVHNNDAYHHHHHHHHHHSVDLNNPSPSSVVKSPHDTHAHGGPVYASQPYGHTHQSIQLTPTQLPPAPPSYGTPPNANFAATNNSNNIGPTTTNSSNNEKSTLNTTSGTGGAPMTTSYPPMQSPRLAYTRTLVGPLSANATRLQDEHRKPGIFFLFQDLSVRTEGTFRLRMRLMNVGAPPAPEYGATKVHTDVSPVLAQTFTEPFTVFSAKRFPGVPDTTALSIAFGNQGQKIPLRNRHGPAKRRRRNDASSAEEEEDSEEAE